MLGNAHGRGWRRGARSGASHWPSAASGPSPSAPRAARLGLSARPTTERKRCDRREEARDAGWGPPARRTVGPFGAVSTSRGRRGRAPDLGFAPAALAPLVSGAPLRLPQGPDPPLRLDSRALFLPTWRRAAPETVGVEVGAESSGVGPSEGRTRGSVRAVSVLVVATVPHRPGLPLGSRKTPSRSRPAARHRRPLT